MPADRSGRMSRAAFAATLAAGMIAGSLLLSPATAHVNSRLGHVLSHLDRTIAPQTAGIVGSSDPVIVNETSTADVITRSFTAPKPGGCGLISASTTVHNPEATEIGFWVRVYLDGALTGHPSESTLGPNDIETITATVPFSADAGAHTALLKLTPLGGPADFWYDDASITVVQVPKRQCTMS